MFSPLTTPAFFPESDTIPEPDPTFVQPQSPESPSPSLPSSPPITTPQTEPTASSPPPFPPIPVPPSPPSSSQPIALRKAPRAPVKPVKYNDYVMHQGTTNSKVSYPMVACLSYEQLSNNYRKYVLAVESTVIPGSFEEAVKEEYWRRAMDLELEALEANHNWDLVPRHAHQKVIGNRWVYNIKFQTDGTIERYKAD
ncbi:unnamed protein product [Linum trigynum]|uniref:Mitochondrial protein n=1 Tax=Linum trigynum TaxID=586398 RepID=A0AAV2DIU6_9ROSI